MISHLLLSVLPHLSHLILATVHNLCHPLYRSTTLLFIPWVAFYITVKVLMPENMLEPSKIPVVDRSCLKSQNSLQQLWALQYNWLVLRSIILLLTMNQHYLITSRTSWFQCFSVMPATVQPTVLAKEIHQINQQFCADAAYEARWMPDCARLGPRCIHCQLTGMYCTITLYSTQNSKLLTMHVYTHYVTTHMSHLK